MKFLKRFYEVLLYFHSFTRYGSAQRVQDENAAYHYVWVMNLKEKERILVVEKKMEILNQISEGKIDSVSGDALLKEIEFKEKMLKSKVIEIEKTRFNAWIIEGYEKEQAARKAITSSLMEIDLLEKDGKIESQEAQILRKELQEKLAIMDKMAAKVPSVPVDLPLGNL